MTITTDEAKRLAAELKKEGEWWAAPQGAAALLSLSAERDALAAECARMCEVLSDQIEQHRATWIAARADVEGAELAAALFEKEPATVRARAALGARAS